MKSAFESDQEDFYGRALGSSFLGDVAVLLQRKGVTESDINTALSVLNSRTEGGPIGACIVVLMPSIQAQNPNAPTPLYSVRIGLQVIEQPLFNLGDSGTGLSAETIAEHLSQLAHQFSGGRDGANNLWVFDGIEPAPAPDGKVSYTVFAKRLGGAPVLPKVAPVALVAVAAAGGFDVTLTSATGGAAILYSIDGSYPSLAYTDPVHVDAGVTVRATAALADYQQSDIRELTT